MKFLVSLLVAAATLLPAANVSAQDLSPPDRRRWLLWFTPTGRHKVEINGIALGLFSEVPDNEGQLRVNGINVEVLPFTVLMTVGGMFFTMLAVAEDEYLPEAPKRFTTEIHGFSFSGGMLEEVHTNGLTWNWLTYAGESKGVEMSLVMNSNYAFSGFQGGMIGNRAAVGTGVQLGMFNTCQDCQNIIQFGFLNRIGRRVIPIVNFSFGKKGTVKTKRSRKRR